MNRTFMSLLLFSAVDAGPLFSVDAGLSSRRSMQALSACVDLAEPDADCEHDADDDDRLDDVDEFIARDQKPCLDLLENEVFTATIG